MKNIFTLIILLTFNTQPIIGQTKKELKAEKKQENYIATKAFINSKQYEFTGEWATSSKGRSISLLSNPTFLKVNNNTGEGDFPFFGTAFSATPYGGDGGIEFNTELENYTINFNDKKQEIVIKFKAKGDNDTYDLIIRVFSSGNTSITINSNNRSVMTYSGKTTALEKKETN